MKLKRIIGLVVDGTDRKRVKKLELENICLTVFEFT
jgi:hypothetical protein